LAGQGPVPARRQKLGTLEIGRFIAASFVMLSHFIPFTEKYAAAPARPLLGGFMTPGPLGVQYFFVLSGFVMASGHYRDFGNLAAIPKFWWRRASRIYPAYWLALCIPMVWLYSALGPAAAAHLYLLDPWGNLQFIPASWTLRYEIAFYIALGLCMLPYAGKPLLALWVVTTIWHYLPVPLLAAIGLGPPFALNYFYNNLLPRFGTVFEFYFFAGLAAGWVFIRLRPGQRLTWAILGAGAALLLWLLPGCAWGLTYGPTALYTMPLALSLALLILGLAGLERHGTLRLGRLAAWLGALSYPLYLLHEPLMLAASLTLPPLRLHSFALYLFFALGLAAIYAVTAAVTFGFDQPIQRALRRLAGRRRAKPAQPRA
jgi:peptidoglycan/LPS O-acetylase OafA/YrhL